MRMLIGRDPDWRARMHLIFGEDAVGGPDDPFALAERLDPAQAPAIRIDCGVDDGLIPHNRALHVHLEALDKLPGPPSHN